MNDLTKYTPLKLQCLAPLPINFKHYAMPMIHPVTGKSILSYRRLMKDPANAETWMTVFGKDFGGMSQGNNKQDRNEQMQCVSCSLQTYLISPRTPQSLMQG